MQAFPETAITQEGRALMLQLSAQHSHGSPDKNYQGIGGDYRVIAATPRDKGHLFAVKIGSVIVHDILTEVKRWWGQLPDSLIVPGSCAPGNGVSFCQGHFKIAEQFS